MPVVRENIIVGALPGDQDCKFLPGAGYGRLLRRAAKVLNIVCDLGGKNTAGTPALARYQISRSQ